MVEPSERQAQYKSDVLSSNKQTLEQLIVQLDQMTFERFLSMKKEWLRSLAIRWFIHGHLNEEDALKMVDQAENSIEFTRINRDDLQLERTVKLEDRTVYSYERENESPENPNSCTNVIH